ALSWQLRTACDLVRLRQGQGRGDEGLTLLQSIYDRFTEGFGTADLIRAEALLESLRPRASAGQRYTMTPSGANFFRSASIADISHELDERRRAPPAQDDHCPRTSCLREQSL